MSEIKDTPTRAPRERFRRDPGRHYLLVQKDAPGYNSPLEDRLDELSPTNPADDMYRIESEDRRDTGDKRMVLLSCSKKDYDARMSEEDAKAQQQMGRVETNPEKGEETITRSKKNNVLVP